MAPALFGKPYHSPWEFQLRHAQRGGTGTVRPDALSATRVLLVCLLLPLCSNPNTFQLVPSLATADQPNVACYGAVGQWFESTGARQSTTSARTSPEVDSEAAGRDAAIIASAAPAFASITISSSPITMWSTRF